MTSKTEDRILLALSLIFAIASIAMFIVGFQIFEASWDTYYIIINISLFTFFIFSILSLLVKHKHKKS